MAIVYHWYGADTGNEGDFNTIANWYDDDGVVAAALPGAAAGDSLVFDDLAAHDLDTNVDQSAIANGLVNVTVKDGFNYAIGSAHAPLILKLAGTPVWAFKGEDHGDIYIVSTTTAVSTCYVVKTPASEDALHLVFGVAATGVRVSGGYVYFDASLGGVANAGIGTLIVTEQDATTTTVILDGPSTTALKQHGGTLYWLSGTITALNQYDGTFSAERAPSGPTLTNCNYYGGTLNLRTGGLDLTVSNPIAVFGDPSNIAFNPGQTISFT